MKQGKETWWWNEDVQESIQTKKLAKRTLDTDTSEENKAAYITAKKEAKGNVAIAKAIDYDYRYADMHGYHRRIEESIEDVEIERKLTQKTFISER